MFTQALPKPVLVLNLPIAAHGTFLLQGTSTTHRPSSPSTSNAHQRVDGDLSKQHEAPVGLGAITGQKHHSMTHSIAIMVLTASD